LSAIINYLIALIFGVLIGNFTTTVYYRLPRNITIFGFDKRSNQPPLCSKCSSILKFYEYLPILSWLSTLGSCNYCGYKIDKTYLFLEVACGIISMMVYYHIGFSEQYIIILSFMAITLLQIALYQKYLKIWHLTIVIQIFCGIIIRTLYDHSIAAWISSLALSLLIFILINKKTSGSLESFIVISLGAWCSIYEFLIYTTMLYLILSATTYLKNYNAKISIYSFSVIYLFFIAFKDYLIVTQ
jgi:prepilin signal peptidase PulO-like enzyme (type II secretory pathway)